MKQYLNSIIIGDDPRARSRLRAALDEVVPYGGSFQAMNTTIGLSLARKEGDIAIVFIRSTIEAEQITKLQDEIKKSNLRYAPIFIITLHTDHNLSEVISNHYLSGIEGFLKEPFTTLDVAEIMRLASEYREKQIAEEEKMHEAVLFMLRDGLSLIDEAAIERVNNNRRGGGFAIKRMKRLKMRIREMSGTVSDMQLQRMVEAQLEKQVEQLDLSLFIKKKIRAGFAEHPGKILKGIFEERSLSSERICELLQLEIDDLESLLNEEMSLTPVLCKSLARVIGNTEDHWRSLQSAFDEYQRSI